MNRRIVAVWVSLAMVIGFIVIIVEIAQIVEAPSTLYVGGTGGGNYSKIQWAIDNASDGDTVYVYNGTYYENVIANKTINLMGEDKYTTIIDGDDKGTVIKVTADWVNVSSLTTRNGGNLGSTYVAGIMLNYVQNCSVINNIAFGARNGICLNNSDFNNVISNNLSTNIIGIFIYMSSNNNIINNNASFNAITGISSHSSNMINLINNYISDNLIGLELYHSSSQNLQGNIMINNGIFIQGHLVKYWNTHNIDTSNKVNNKLVYYIKNQTGGMVPSDAGEVILAYCTNIEIINLDIEQSTTGILLGFSDYNNISFNSVSDNLYGIFLFLSDRNNITYNYFSDSNYGIDLSGSNENNITDNYLFSNGQGGIGLMNSHFNNIIRNNASSNYDGFYLQYAKGNIIQNNNISPDNDFGIKLIQVSENNVITSNNILYNTYGFYINTDSSNNSIYHNNIISNEIQAYDEMIFENMWDNGYPTGGNFWSDYNGSDVFFGPDQDIPGGDGIGDTNYSIDIDSIDNYPLMTPIGNYLFLSEGWNLISIPFIQPITDLDTVFTSIKNSFRAIQWYKVQDSFDSWKHYSSSKPSQLNDLDNIDHLRGFWIYITKQGGVLFEYSGTRPTSNQTIQLYKGWNMVGYPSLTNHSRTEGLNNLEFGTDVDCIQWYNAAAGTWHFMGPDDYFVPERGYWVHAITECEWEVPL